MAGEYRTSEALAQIDQEIAEQIRAGKLRIAKADQPMTGVQRRPDLSETLAVEYERIGMTSYSKGLRDGTSIPIFITTGGDDHYWTPGELFFRS